MSFLIVDNKRQDLDALTSIFAKSYPNISVTGSISAEEALDLPDLNFDVAFIDAELEPDKMNGIELAERLKTFNKDIHIIFTTKSKKYLLDAFHVHADAYLIKPVSEENIRRELNYLMKNYPAPLKENPAGKIVVQTFGLFSVFVDGKLLEFERNKAKELLALLVDRRGLPVKIKEACAVLFPKAPFSHKSTAYYHVVVNSLTRTLRNAGISDMIIRKTSYLAINPDRFDCDAYRFLKGDVRAKKQFKGDYLMGYKWPGIPVHILIDKGAKTDA